MHRSWMNELIRNVPPIDHQAMAPDSDVRNLQLNLMKNRNNMQVGG